MRNADSDGAADATRLALQRMERALVRARLAIPHALPGADYACLRYALGLARLHVFTPFNARRPRDVAVDQQRTAPLVDWLLSHLQAPLTARGQPDTTLAACREAAPTLHALTRETRSRLLAAHASDFDAAALDREAGRRALVVVAGGGGGAGYVYAGAFIRLIEAGLTPEYIIGNSIGAILGVLRARRRVGDADEYLSFAGNLQRNDIFNASPRRRVFCMPGLLQLHLRALHQRLVVGELRRPMRLDEMAIPLDIVVAGIRRRSYERLAPDMREPLAGAGHFLPTRLRVAARLTRLLQFFSSDAVEPIVLGRDRDTRRIHAVDAAGFSAAVPSILQYEPGPRAGATREILAELMARRELAAIVDGGVADNVPARAAWNGIKAGRAGTRNAYYLAFDCFSPRMEPKNLWLWPIMQTVQMQMRVNRVYADTLVRFNRTLSPLNIVPGARSIHCAIDWGHQQMDVVLPEVREMMRPVRLDSSAAGHAS